MVKLNEANSAGVISFLIGAEETKVLAATATEKNIKNNVHNKKYCIKDFLLLTPIYTSSKLNQNYYLKDSFLCMY